MPVSIPGGYNEAPKIANATTTLLGNYIANPQTLAAAGFEARNGGLFDLKTNQMLQGVTYNPGETQILTDPTLLPGIMASRNITATTQTPREAAIAAGSGQPAYDIDPNAVPGGQAPLAPLATTEPPRPAPTTQKITSLVDIYNSRSDLQQAFPNALGAGSPTNQALNDWWNANGAKEYPGVTLVAPGTAGIQNPTGLAAPSPAQPPPVPTAPLAIGTTLSATPAPVQQPARQPQAVQAPQNITSLVDIWTSRPDLQTAFPQQGQMLNDWWNQYGVKEYPNTQLVEPGTQGIQDPRTLEASMAMTNVAEPVNEASQVTPADFQTNPIKAFTTLYKDALTSTGVLSFKEEFDKLTEKMSTEVSDIMNDPWLTQGVKDARIKKVNDKYETKLGLYKTLYEGALAEAKYITTGAYNAYADATKADALALQNAADNALNMAKLQGGSEMTTDQKEYAMAVEQGFGGSLLDWQREQANLKRPVTNISVVGASGLTGAQLGQLNAISDNARQDKDIAVFADIRGSYEQALQAYQQKNSAGDIVLMRTLAKITDPSSAVREEEFRTFQSAVGTIPRYGVQVTSQMVGRGQLTQNGRDQLFGQVSNIYKQRLAAYNSKAGQYQAQADRIAPGEGVNFIPTYTAPEPVAPQINYSPAPAPQNQSFVDSVKTFLFGK